MKPTGSCLQISFIKLQKQKSATNSDEAKTNPISEGCRTTVNQVNAQFDKETRIEAIELDIAEKLFTQLGTGLQRKHTVAFNRLLLILTASLTAIHCSV